MPTRVGHVTIFQARVFGGRIKQDVAEHSISEMSLWVDKHRPTSINKLDYHKEQASRLKKLVMENLAQLYGA